MSVFLSILRDIFKNTFLTPIREVHGIVQIKEFFFLRFIVRQTLHKTPYET